MADASAVTDLKLRIRSNQQHIIRRRAVVLDYSPWDAVDLEMDAVVARDGKVEDLVPDRPRVSAVPVRRAG